MKTRLLIFSLLLSTLSASATPSPSASEATSPVVSTASHETEKPALNVDRQLAYCHSQIHRALNELQQKDGSLNYAMEPRNILGQDKQKGWNCRPATAEEWCGGFWPGILWMDYSVSKDTAVLTAAEGYTAALRHIAYEPIFDHDIGFPMFCSFGKGYDALTQSGDATDRATQRLVKDYRRTICASADSLATLFNPMVGTLLSWPRNVKMFGGHNTIMDNMMNLDMMFWASRNGGNPLLYDLAVAHAKTTMQHHFRPDGSCYHVAVYDSLDGRFIKGVTHQGYSDASMWARGQSWAIYGYTMVYRYTHNPVFLQFAQKVTDVYLRRLGCQPTAQGGLETAGSLIPKWDFDDPDAKASKDASAACVVADALLELCHYVDGVKGQYYKAVAIRMLAELSTPEYLSGKRNVSFLLHSTGHHPAGSEIDASIIYADYYYLEALLRAKKLGVRN
mgnify:CR=1 FL=1